MVEGIPPGRETGWGHLYFRRGYTEELAAERGAQTRTIVMDDRGLDIVFVVPTEPLARLATQSPRQGLITHETVSAANFALWRVHVFNQLVGQLTDFNTRHVAELANADDDRLEAIGNAACSLSTMLHRNGVGQSWTRDFDGGAGWYRQLVDALDANISALAIERRDHRFHWFDEWPAAVDGLLVGAIVGWLVGTLLL